MCLSFKIIKQKQKTQFAFCYLHVDLKRETFRTRYPHPCIDLGPSPRLEVCACCVTLIWMLHVARCLVCLGCIGMRHDTATTPSIKPKRCPRGQGWHVDFRFSTETQWNRQTEQPTFAHPRQALPASPLGMTQKRDATLSLRSSCHHAFRPCRHSRGFRVSRLVTP